MRFESIPLTYIGKVISHLSVMLPCGTMCKLHVPTRHCLVNGVVQGKPGHNPTVGCDLGATVGNECL